MTNPLDMPLGRQNRAARMAGVTLAEWRKQQMADKPKPKVMVKTKAKPKPKAKARG